MSDNTAVLAGYTEELIAAYDDLDIHIMHQPNADLDTRVRVWNCDHQEFITINGWMFTYSECE